MPTVPVYTPGQVKANPLPEVRQTANATAESFGGADARSLGNIGEGIGRWGGMVGDMAVRELQIQNRLQETEDNNAARAAFNSMREEANNYMLDNVRKKEGIDAAGVDLRVKDDLPKLAERIGKNLTPEQRKRFDSAVLTLIPDYVAQAQEHRFKQTMKADIDTKNANSKTALDNAIANKDNASEVNKALDEIVANTRSLNQGSSPEVMNLKVKEALSTAHSQIAMSHADQSAAKAILYINDAFSRGEMDSKVYSKLKNEFQQMDVQQSAYHTANGVVPYVDTAEQAREMITKQEKDPVKVEAAMQQVKVMLNEKYQAKTLAEKKEMEDALSNVINNPSAPINPNMKPDVYREALALKAKLQSGESAAMNQNAYGKLLQMASEDPKKFMTEPLHKYFPALGKDDIKYFSEKQQKMIKGENPNTPAFKQAHEYAEGVMKEMTYFSVSDSVVPDEKERLRNANRRAMFMEQVDRRLRALPEEKRNYVEAQKIVDELTKEVTLEKRSRWGMDWLASDVMGKQFEKNVQGKVMPEIPEKLRPLKDQGLQWDEVGGLWYNDAGNKRFTYSADGNPLDTYTRKSQTPAAPAAPAPSESVDYSNTGERNASPGKAPEPLSDEQAANDPAFEKSVQFAKNAEGFTPEAYDDFKQVSVGYGTRGKKGEKLTEAEADQRLREELKGHFDSVTAAAKKKGLDLNQNEVAALTSFDFNTGRGADVISRANDKEDLKRIMKQYTKAGGKQLAGLKNRRDSEIRLFEATI